MKSLLAVTAAIAALVFGAAPATAQVANEWPVVPPLPAPYASGEDVAGVPCDVAGVTCGDVIASGLGYTIETGALTFRLQEGTAVGQGVHLQSLLQVNEYQGAMPLVIEVAVVPVCVTVRTGDDYPMLNEVRGVGEPSVYRYDELAPGEYDDTQFFLLDVDDDCSLLFERRDVLTVLSASPDAASFEPSPTEGWDTRSNAFPAVAYGHVNQFCTNQNNCVRVEVITSPAWGEVGFLTLRYTWVGIYNGSGNAVLNGQGKLPVVEVAGAASTVANGTLDAFSPTGWGTWTPAIGATRLVTLNINSGIHCMKLGYNAASYSCAQVAALPNDPGGVLSTVGGIWWAGDSPYGLGEYAAPLLSYASLTIYDPLDAIIWEGVPLGTFVDGIDGWCASYEECFTRCQKSSFDWLDPGAIGEFVMCLIVPQVQPGEFTDALVLEFTESSVVRAAIMVWDAVRALPMSFSTIGSGCGELVFLDAEVYGDPMHAGIDICAFQEDYGEYIGWIRALWGGTFALAYCASLISLMLSAMGIRVPLVDALTDFELGPEDSR